MMTRNVNLKMCMTIFRKWGIIEMTTGPETRTLENVLG